MWTGGWRIYIRYNGGREEKRRGKGEIAEMRAVRLLSRAQGWAPWGRGRVSAFAPSASSRLFFQHHTFHYQSKVCVCLCASSSAYLGDSFSMLSFKSSLHISSTLLLPSWVHLNVRFSLMRLTFHTSNWQKMAVSRMQLLQLMRQLQ